MGLPKGTTNNPKGRPLGAKNKTSKEIRESIALFLDSKEEEFQKRMLNLEDKDFCSLYLKMAKMLIPPISSVYYTALEPTLDWIDQ